MSFHEYEEAGAFYTYLSGDADRAEQNLATCLEVFRAVQADGLTDEEIRQAKSKLGSRIVRGSERPMGRMQALGFYWTYLKQYRTVDEDLEAIDAVTARDVRAVLDRYPLDRVTVAALGPLNTVRLPGGNGRPQHGPVGELLGS
jgi:predicted Zn-dependent peptidase